MLLLLVGFIPYLPEFSWAFRCTKYGNNANIVADLTFYFVFQLPSFSFSIASNDDLFRSCVNTRQLFAAMFSDSDIAKKMTMSQTKASYSITNGLGDLMIKDIYKEIQATDGGFTWMFDETTTNQGKKQMDLLLHFFSESQTVVVTKYVASFFFGHTTGEDLCKPFKNFISNKKFNIPWNRLVCLSSDGSAINKKLYKLLSPLLPFVPCTLHIFHKAFFKGIASLPLDVDQFAFDLHAWFKRRPCKKEDSYFWPKAVTCQHVTKLFL